MLLLTLKLQHSPILPPSYSTQEDIDTGSVAHEAAVRSSSPAPLPLEVTANASCTTPVPRQPGVSISKEVTDITAASGLDPALTDAEDTFEYSITVSNTGNTWLSDVVVSDPMFDGLECDSSYVGNSSRFTPREEIVCTGLLTLDQAHIDGRCVGNTANVRNTEGRT